MIKKGDTLIEVTLAIGIFSMIAIAVVSVVNSSTSGAQSALETTLAREEIDTQAEALRFIHSSYIASSGSATSGNEKYIDLWQEITSRAVDKDNVSDDILKYSPSTCSELYNGSNLYNQGAFIINTRLLASDNVDNIILKATPAGVSTRFYQATTYPRIIYSTTTDDESLLDQGTGVVASRIEGIYVVAVRDMDSTYIVPDGSSVAEKTSAYYDFYIRTCWYGPGATRPSTISTVIRLYDPDAVSSGQSRYSTPTTTIVYHGNGSDNISTTYTQKISAGTTRNLIPNRFTKIGETFYNWQDSAGNVYEDGSSYTASAGDNYVNLYANWIPNHFDFTIHYLANASGVSGSVPDQVLSNATVDTKFTISDNEGGFTRNRYQFTGWNSAADGSGTRYNPGESYRVSDFKRVVDFTNNPSINLYAQWEKISTTITVTLTWGATPADLDLHLVGQKADGTDLHVSYSSTTQNDTDNVIMASLSGDVRNGYGPETISLEAHNNKNYYFYVHCYTTCSKIEGATITVTSPDLGTVTFSSDEASVVSSDSTDKSRYWNVFAYKNGHFITKQTHTGSADTSY